MDEESYRRARQFLVDEIKPLGARLRGLQAAINALDSAWAAIPSGDTSSPRPDAPPELDRSKPFPPLWSHKAIIMEVARRMRGNFNVDDVKDAVDQIGTYAKQAPMISKSTISGRLKNMASAQGQLQLVYRGTGSRPSVYRVKEKRSEDVATQNAEQATS